MVIVALVGAAVIANALAAPAARLVTPLIRESIETRVDEAMAQQSQEVQMPEEDVDEGFAIADLLALMGLDEDVRDSLVRQTEEKIQDTIFCDTHAPERAVASAMTNGAAPRRRHDFWRDLHDAADTLFKM